MVDILMTTVKADILTLMIMTSNPDNILTKPLAHPPRHQTPFIPPMTGILLTFFLKRLFVEHQCTLPDPDKAPSTALHPNDPPNEREATPSPVLTISSSLPQQTVNLS